MFLCRNKKKYLPCLELLVEFYMIITRITVLVTSWQALSERGSAFSRSYFFSLSELATFQKGVKNNFPELLPQKSYNIPSIFKQSLMSTKYLTNNYYPRKLCLWGVGSILTVFTLSGHLSVCPSATLVFLNILKMQ